MASAPPNNSPTKLSPQKRKLLILASTLFFSALFLIVLFKDSTPAEHSTAASATYQHNNPAHDTTNQKGANYNKYYSQYYDLLYTDKDYVKEINYLHSTIQKHHSPAKEPKDMNLLELGCGTGKHAHLLHSTHGYNVLGVDMSKEMVFRARDKYRSEVQSGQVAFQEGDARSFRDTSGKKYDVVLSLFHVVSYQITNQHLLDEFKTATHHLKPGGLFIFDVWYGPAVLTTRPTKRTKKMENDEVRVLRHATPQIHPNINAVDVNYHIQVTDKKTGQDFVFDEKHPMRYLFRPELENFLNQVGIELVDMEEWVTGKQPGFDTWGVTFIGRYS